MQISLYDVETFSYDVQMSLYDVPTSLLEVQCTKPYIMHHMKVFGSPLHSFCLDTNTTIFPNWPYYINSEDPYQTQHRVASDLDLHCLHKKT